MSVPPFIASQGLDPGGTQNQVYTHQGQDTNIQQTNFLGTNKGPPDPTLDGTIIPGQVQQLQEIYSQQAKGTGTPYGTPTTPVSSKPGGRNKGGVKRSRTSPTIVDVLGQKEILTKEKEMLQAFGKIEKVLTTERVLQQQEIYMIINQMTKIKENMNLITSDYKLIYDRVNEGYNNEAKQGELINAVQNVVREETIKLVNHLNGEDERNETDMEINDESGQPRQKGIKHLLEKINSEIKDIKEKITGTDKKSYANAVKLPGVNKPVVPRNKPTILIYPEENKKEELTTSKLTKDAVMNFMKPSTIGIQVERVREIRNAGISIELSSGEDANKLHDQEVWKQIGVKTKIPGRKCPKVIIYGVPTEIEENHLAGEIKRQIPEINLNDVRLVGKTGPRNKETCHVILECSAQSRQALLNRGKLYLEWSSCIIKDHISILQCYKCQEFGHIAEKCTSSNPNCRFCSSQEHDSKACVEKIKADFKPQCVLCKKFGVQNTDHIASDNKHCEIWKRKYMAILKNIDYES